MPAVHEPGGLKAAGLGAERCCSAGICLLLDLARYGKRSGAKAWGGQLVMRCRRSDGCRPGNILDLHSGAGGWRY